MQIQKNLYLSSILPALHLLFYLAANMVSHSEFSMKFEGNENKMISIYQFMREEQTWNGENDTARSFILYFPHIMLRKSKEGNLSAGRIEKCIQN